jgi:hypothetical protein
MPADVRLFTADQSRRAVATFVRAAQSSGRYRDIDYWSGMVHPQHFFLLASVILCWWLARRVQ